MPNTVDFLPFATGTDAPDNVIDQATYTTLPARSTGFQSGLARSAQLNKVWRQSSFISAAVAKFVSLADLEDVLDNGDLDAFVAQLQTAVFRTAGRMKLTLPLDLYVTVGGNDANDGLTVPTAFATLQRAWDYLQFGIDLNGQPVTIHVGTGTYERVSILGTPLGQNGPQGITFLGDLITPGNVLIAAFNANAIEVLGAQATFKGFALEASGSGGDTGNGIYVRHGQSQVAIDRIAFGACSSVQMLSIYGAFLGTLNGGSYEILGASGVHMQGIFGGTINVGSSVVTLTGTPTFGTAFARADNCGVVDPTGVNFVGTAFGQRYLATTNGVINTSGSGPTFLPGSVDGAVNTGGQYV